jgi:hypothetical protein
VKPSTLVNSELLRELFTGVKKHNEVFAGSRVSALWGCLTDSEGMATCQHREGNATTREYRHLVPCLWKPIGNSPGMGGIRGDD